MQSSVPAASSTACPKATRSRSRSCPSRSERKSNSLIGTEDATTVGRPNVPGAVVVGKVVFNGRAPKIIVYKIRRRKNYRRKAGHRQAFTRLVIQGIKAE